MKQKKVTINGQDFQLQSMPFKSYMELIDRNMNKYGVLNRTGYSEELLKHCVIEPKVTMESFDDDFGTGQKLIQAVETFLNAPNKPKEDKTESKE